MTKKILVIEDEYSINDILTLTLINEGYEVESFFDGKTALERIEVFKPDLVLLDLMLPDIDGFEICKKISKDLLVIMITARDSIFDKIIGLELGADDYIIKPFEIKEVIARVKALFRSIEKEKQILSEEFIELGGSIKVDLLGERVFKNGEEIQLKRQESDLFFFLLKNRNRVFTRAELLDSVWGYDYYGGSRTVDVHIRRIRDKLETSTIIETVFGKGYVMR
ncbi:DNA-binding response regulator, OmpR family, contains REC and winged-helix (wHTH) domain [Proteiniborus ethanoligenes]|uniref:Stage 0 sporulation protein A homolog n=1 Tax=Proteiniborus ethanoligenes TaxID=415015 RepID=A0A1H3P8X2_9FIRM|nr:response regulator transcription factor [Proteiniborus ethanoligenes]SDY97572.1 DNA-binding response regulator, OmpR family, contains REC and winged-helix (wHTH) domain [Proteiniborus ethanoligenes]